MNKKIFPSFFFRINFYIKQIFSTLILLLAVPSLSLVNSCSLRSSEAANAIDILDKAYQSERPLESRITKFSFAPFNNFRGKTEDVFNSTERDHAEIILHSAAAKNPTGENLYFLGKLNLAKKDFDKAIEQFQNALKILPANAEIHNDLGVALMEKGKSEANENTKNFELLAKALEELAIATETNDKLLEAVFNKALCLQSINLPIQAKKTWQEYLSLDEGSSWAKEARRNLQMLESKNLQDKTSEEIMQDFFDAYSNKDKESAYQISSRNREMISEKLVPQNLALLFLKTEESVEKQKYLSALKFIGDLEKEKSGDPFFAEMAGFYSSITKEKEKKLLEAQLSVREGYALCAKPDFLAAIEKFEHARQIFNETKDIWEAAICDYWIAYSDYQKSSIAESNEKLLAQANFTQTKNYKWLSSQIFYCLAVNAKAVKEMSKAFSYGELALKYSEETFDSYNIQKTYNWLTDMQISLNQYQKAFLTADKIIFLGSLPAASLRQNFRDYYIIAQLLYEVRLYRTAVIVEQEAFELNSSKLEDFSFERGITARLGRTYGTLKRYDQAFAFFGKSREAAEKLPDEKNRQKGMAFAFLQIANLKIEAGDYQSALSDYEKAIELYDSMEYQTYLYEAEKGRLLCHLAIKNDEAIQKEIPEVLSLFEDNRTKILEEQNRNSFFDTEQNIYDLAIDYEFAKGNYETAFNHSEKSRSRSLLDWQKNGGKVVDIDKGTPQIVFSENVNAIPLQFSEIQQQIPAGVQLIQYAVLSDKVLIWLIDREKMKAFSVQISSDELESNVTGFLEAVKNRDTNTQNDLARRLYQILFSPVEENIEKEKEICLIPDKILFHLPFNALISDKTENFLIAQYKLFSAPSANVFLNASKSAENKKNSGNQEKLLSIGNPAFDRKEFPNFSDLPAAENEAAKISDFYPDHTLLLDKNATKSNLKTKISQNDVVHFAGHYTSNEFSELLSGFLVAGNGKESRLSNYELLNEKIEKPRLIVLSACQTGVEKYYKGEGMIGAARTFLALGVPIVVASQWKVDSDATAELMKKFHYFRKTEKLSTVSALRRAQLEMLNNPNPNFRQPFFWAGFLMLGGYAEF